MGKNSWQKAWGNASHPDGGDGSPQWQQWQWQQSYVPQPKSHAKGQGKANGQTPSFPKYDAMKVPGETPWEEKNDVALTESGGCGTDAIMRIEKLVNYIKKAELKQKKLRDTVKTGGEQWQLFQQELQKSFVQQRQSYCSDIQELEHEQYENEKSRMAAVKDLKESVSGNGTPKPPSSSMQMTLQKTS